MTNTITVDQLKELLQIQKDFDSRIPTLNLQDSKVAYVVEFFEWFNTLETFKNWKENPGKPLDVQLDELADLLAFGLSIANQTNVKINDIDTINGYLNNVQEKPVKLNEIWDFHDVYVGLSDLLITDELNNYDALTFLILLFGFGIQYYSIDQLIKAYKKKMTHNHLRQDGAVDIEKGYV